MPETPASLIDGTSGIAGERLPSVVTAKARNLPLLTCGSMVGTATISISTWPPITAANASTLADGAAALMVGSEAALARYQARPLARIVATAVAGRAPEEFPIAPVDAITKVVARAGLTLADIDLYEINEAFAVVVIAAIRALALDPATVNVRGGAIALGHPIGASGARVLTTLVAALGERRARYGLATLCLGGGEAIAMIIERSA